MPKAPLFFFFNISQTIRHVKSLFPWSKLSPSSLFIKSSKSEIRCVRFFSCSGNVFFVLTFAGRKVFVSPKFVWQETEAAFLAETTAPLLQEIGLHTVGGLSSEGLQLMTCSHMKMWSVFERPYFLRKYQIYWIWTRVKFNHMGRTVS